MGVRRLVLGILTLLAIDASAQCLTWVTPTAKLNWSDASGPVAGYTTYYQDDDTGPYIVEAWHPLYEPRPVFVGLPLCGGGRRFQVAASANHVAPHEPHGPSSLSSECIARCGNPDLDHGGAVGLTDYFLFGAAFGCTVGQGCYNPDADFDQNNVVGISDYGYFGQHFGHYICGDKCSVEACP